VDSIVQLQKYKRENWDTHEGVGLSARKMEKKRRLFFQRGGGNAGKKNT